jgi:hypothetical protein
MAIIIYSWGHEGDECDGGTTPRLAELFDAGNQ